MAQKVDWGRMYKHLERVQTSAREDVRAEGISLISDVDITLGRKPPRIYVELYRGELGELTESEDLSPEVSEKHSELCKKIGQVSRIVDKIMKKHGLRSYHVSPHFKGEGSFMSAYGYDHSQYRISSKK